MPAGRIHNRKNVGYAMSHAHRPCALSTSLSNFLIALEPDGMRSWEGNSSMFTLLPEQEEKAEAQKSGKYISS